MYNYAIQGFATGFCVPIAVLCMWHRIRDVDGLTMVNTVHDSACTEVAQDRVEDLKALAALWGDDTMRYCKEIYGIDFTVPLEVETKIGTHWAGKDCEEHVHVTEPTRKAV